jgi:hypothetical protein
VTAAALKGNATHQVALLGAVGREGAHSIDALAEHLPIARPKISAAAGKLIARGLLERVETGVFRLTPEGGQFLETGGSLTSGPNRPTGPRPTRLPDTFRQRAWNAMRLTPRFLMADILTLAARPGDGSPEANLHRFVSQLIAAGYVAVLPSRAPGSRPTSNGHRIYTLVHRDSEAAPVFLQQKGALRDGDTGEVFPCRRP